ncbi:hypothetical protein BJX76DRAFT_357338 [Aspergillus varians]
MRVIAAFVGLLAFAYASPALESRQQGQNCVEVFFPETCDDRGLVYCDGAGSIAVCCTRCN